MLAILSRLRCDNCSSISAASWPFSFMRARAQRHSGDQLQAAPDVGRPVGPRLAERRHRGDVGRCPLLPLTLGRIDLPTEQSAGVTRGVARGLDTDLWIYADAVRPFLAVQPILQSPVTSACTLPQQ